jgi:hypothetical protein
MRFRWSPKNSQLTRPSPPVAAPSPKDSVALRFVDSFIKLRGWEKNLKMFMVLKQGVRRVLE